MHTVYGIRHHGPGSAKRLEQALEATLPDCLLLELPADAQSILKYVGDHEMRPPVALLLYAPNDLSKAIYLPFASYSPEWIALRHAARRGIPIVAIDLPASVLFSAPATGEPATLFETENMADEARDPLGQLARLAGYTDSERWWEIIFEQNSHRADVFDTILDMTRALREASPHAESAETMLREACMRQEIRKARKAGYANIAAVCGAWHAPALAALDAWPASQDARLLRGLKKVKTAAAWIPWSYERLARHSGYGAGVHSPVWYELLFHQREEATVRWMSRLAQLLREEGIDVSPAHALEAVRLAEALAAMRELSLPGLDEMTAAASTVMCQGDPTLIAMMRDRLIVGDIAGKISKAAPSPPLLKDLERFIRQARLTKEWESTAKVEKTLDLRKDTQRLASRLLHRLEVLNIPWGALGERSSARTGSFSETWTLKWRPEFTIRLIEAGMYGNTVEEAAENYLLRESDAGNDLLLLSSLLLKALNAGLPAAVGPLIDATRTLAALTRDVERLMDILPPMIDIARYGDVRQTDAGAVNLLIDEIIPRACIGMPAACLGIGEEVAAQLFQRMLAVNNAFGLIDKKRHQQHWRGALRQTATLDGAHPLPRGAALRLLFDRGWIAPEEARDRAYHALSRGQPALAGAHWLEGFLHGGGPLLAHYPELWMLIDEWLRGLSSNQFAESLPLLRRAFSRFHPSERQQLARMIRRHVSPPFPADAAEERRHARGDYPLPTLLLILGNKEDKA